MSATKTTKKPVKKAVKNTKVVKATVPKKTVAKKAVKNTKVVKATVPKKTVAKKVVAPKEAVVKKADKNPVVAKTIVKTDVKKPIVTAGKSTAHVRIQTAEGKKRAMLRKHMARKLVRK